MVLYFSSCGISGVISEQIDPNDAELILNLIETGDISDLEELNESDEEDVVIEETQRNIVRSGRLCFIY